MSVTQVKTDGIANDAVTLAKQAAGTDGQVITYDASGNPTAVGPGTDGQVLTSTGAGSPPAFENLEGANIKSTGESGGSKFLREDGDGTCSWQTLPASGATLANGADNRVVTATSASALTGESTLTYDAGALAITGDSSGDGLTITNDGDHYTSLTFDADRGSAKNAIGIIQGKWNNTAVTEIKQMSGDDTTNKDDGIITFSTCTAGTLREKMRITNVGDGPGEGQIRIGDTDLRHTIEAGLTVHYDSGTAAAGALNLSRTGTGEVLSMGICNAYGKVGDIKTNGTSTSFNTSSDYRLKENQVSISDGITRVKQLKPYRFNFKTDKAKTLDGFFAHEAQAVVPQAVSGTKDQTKTTYYSAQDERDGNIPSGKKVGDVKDANAIDAQSIDHSHLVPLLTAALKEAITKIETLETKVAALEAG